MTVFPFCLDLAPETQYNLTHKGLKFTYHMEKKRMSRNTKFVVIALAVFVAGAALAVWQNSRMLTPAEQTAIAQDQAATETASADMPSTAAGAVVPEAPAMPETAAGEADPHAGHNAMMMSSDAATVAGVQAGGPFTLTDHKGTPVTEKSWPGKYKLVFFGFTNCPDICPATLQKIGTLMESYDASGAKIQPLFITIDPARDTQDVVAKYVGNFSPTIVGLTGTEEQLKQAQAAYKVYSSPATGEGAEMKMDHSSYIYLISPEDKLLEVISANLSAEELTARVKAKVEAASTELPATASDAVAGTATESAAPAATGATTATDAPAAPAAITQEAPASEEPVTAPPSEE
jgi:protein SCO1